MLLSIVIAFTFGLIYWQKPSRITKILSYVATVLAALGLAIVSVFVILSSSQIAPSVTYTVYLPLSYPITTIRVSDSLNHVFNQAVVFFWPRGVPVVFSGYRQTNFFNITLFDTISLLAVGTINIITAIVFLIIFYKRGIQHLPQQAPTDYKTAEPIVDDGSRQPPTSTHQQLIRRTQRSKRIRLLLVCTGLILLLVGALFIIAPLRVPRGIVQEEFNFAPNTNNQNEITIPFNFAYAVNITVSFDNYSLSDDRRVWLDSYAALHAWFFGFGQSTSLTRWENVTTIEFIFGLENSTLFFVQYPAQEIIEPIEALLFIESLTIKVSYSGIQFASCNVTIVVHQNILFIPGLILLGLAAIPFWILIRMIWNEYRKERINLTRPLENNQDEN